MLWFIKLTLLCLFMFPLSSCTKKAEYELRGDALHLSLESAEISDVRSVSWSVGDGKTVSKGIEVSVKLPILDRKLMEMIFEKYNADAWGIRVQEASLTRTRAIGHFYVPIISTSSERVRARSRSPKGISFRVFYAAASASSRFADLPCPPMGHRFKIENTSVSSLSQSHSLEVRQSFRNTINTRVRELGYFPLTLNGGRNLQGRYEVELALYNSRDEYFTTPFRPISNQARVHSESPMSVPECDGYEPPPPDAGGGFLENFQFGR